MEGLERYKKIKDLGEGAQGNVILAWDTLLERNVAIKSLHMSLTSDTLHVKRFKEEAKTLASLGHPSIVGVYEYIANSSGCHLMMEYFEGHPLDLYIRNVTGPIPEERTIDIFIKVLEAMSHIHKKKIIHRDIKPSNIMINDKSEIRLLDFGIAKNTENDPTLTKIGGSAGYTPMYMSPEHCNGEPITKYSDIYSLGITLWQMLTGKAPYEGFSQGQIYSKVANEPLPSIQSVYPKVSLKMNAIVQKATQKDPKKRFTTCDAFKKELEQLKKHIKDIHTDFIFNLSVNIANGIDATIYLDEEQHYGTEFSKSFDVSKNSPITIKIEKPGYKKIEQQLFLKKNEVMNFNIEKQTDSFASLLLELKNNTAPYLKNISPNLSKLLIYLKLTSLWAFESVQLKFKKNNSEALVLNTIETKKAIAGTVNTIKPHKKEYASYLVLLSLIFVAIFSFSTEKEALITDGTPEETPVFIPKVNFETLKTGIPESQNVVKIAVVLSETTDSIVKIPLKFSGTATKDDYTILTETLILQANQKKGFIELDIINDKIKEQDETILIELQNPINATLGEQFNYSYTILNEDSKIIIPKKTPKKKYPARGKKFKEICYGVDLYQYYHDGKGGSFRGSIIRKNSTSCGYKAPLPTVQKNYYQNIIAREPHDRRTSPNSDGYFITIQDNGKRKSLIKVWKITSQFKVNEYEIIGKIDNIHYSNHKFYTNKSRPIDHHIINILDKNKSYLGSTKVWERKFDFQKKGPSEENKIISN